MAVGASPRRHRVRTGQRETGAVVIEGRIRPCRRAVASIAGLREIRGYVVRIGRAVVVRQVARHTSRARQIVVVIHVTIRASARRNRMRSRQREAGVVVIKGRIRPRRSVVALIAGLREIRRDVIRIGRAVIVRQVTRHASCAVQAVIIVGVAIAANSGRNRMSTG